MAHVNYKNYPIPMLIHTIDNYRLSFSVESVKKENHDWLCSVLGYQIDEIYELAYNKGVKDTQNSIKKTLGLTSSEWDKIRVYPEIAN